MIPQLHPRFTLLFVKLYSSTKCIQICNRYYVGYLGMPVSYKDKSLLGVKWNSRRIIIQFLFCKYEYTR